MVEGSGVDYIVFIEIVFEGEIDVFGFGGFEVGIVVVGGVVVDVG